MPEGRIERVARRLAISSPVLALLTLSMPPSFAENPEMNPVLLGVVAAPATIGDASGGDRANGDDRAGGDDGVNDRAGDDKETGLRVLHVLERSPAADAGLQAGDVLTRVDGAALRDPADLDRALKDGRPGARVGIEWWRNGKSQSGHATLVHWRSYRGTFLRGRTRGQTGFEAPAWYAYAWDLVDGGPGASWGATPPTRHNTDGKVVVIHAFQSW